MSPFSINPDSFLWHLRAAQKVVDPIEKIIQKALDSNCTIMVVSGDGQWTGSGSHIGGGIIATAAHVAPPELQSSPSEIAVSFDGENLMPAEVIASDPNVDSALLYAPNAKSIPSVGLASEEAEIGDIIAVIGTPEGWHDTATVGRVSNIHQSMGQNAPTPAWNDLYFIDADILQGASGGMVINTAGDVIGSVMGVTGMNAQIGIGERAVCPSQKIIALYKKSIG